MGSQLKRPMGGDDNNYRKVKNVKDCQRNLDCQFDF